jgi:hypothetical protein
MAAATAGGANVLVEYDDGSFQVFNCLDLQFAKADFVLASPGAGQAKVNTKGLSITVQYCDGDGSIHSLVFVDGLLQQRV